MAVDIAKCSNKDSEKCLHIYNPIVDDFCAVIEDRQSHPSKFLQLYGVNSTCPIHAVSMADIEYIKFRIKIKPSLIFPGRISFHPDRFQNRLFKSDGVNIWEFLET